MEIGVQEFQNGLKAENGALGKKGSQNGWHC